MATGGGSNTSIRDNILVAGAGYALRVGDDTQVGFASNYNLFHTFGTGKLALWEGRDFVTLSDWFYETGNDVESVVGDPQFVDIDGADGILGFVGGVDGGVDDDFRLSVGSPGVDRGDPLSLFLAEPDVQRRARGSRRLRQYRRRRRRARRSWCRCSIRTAWRSSSSARRCRSTSAAPGSRPTTRCCA